VGPQGSQTKAATTVTPRTPRAPGAPAGTPDDGPGQQKARPTNWETRPSSAAGQKASNTAGETPGKRSKHKTSWGVAAAAISQAAGRNGNRGPPTSSGEAPKPSWRGPTSLQPGERRGLSSADPANQGMAAGQQAQTGPARPPQGDQQQGQHWPQDRIKHTAPGPLGRGQGSACWDTQGKAASPNYKYCLGLLAIPGAAVATLPARCPEALSFRR